MRAFTIIDVPQRSDEWFAARLGRLTGSRANDMLKTVKSGGEAAGRRNLLTQLVLERITGRSHESDYISTDMQNGIDREAEALRFYEAISARVIQTCGFLQHTELMTGCSPDAYVGDFVGLVSAKCPKPATHLDYLETKKVPLEYFRQIQHELWISGAEWCDFLSYQPDFPEDIRALVVTVKREDAALDAYDVAAKAFLKDVDDKVLAVDALRRKAQAAA